MRDPRKRRWLVTGAEWRLDDALAESEGSTKLNTALVERLNLTIPSGVSYLGRRTTCHARVRDRLEDALELFRYYYNFIRPHRALRFGPVTRTPAVQARLVSSRLSFRHVFLAVASLPARLRPVFQLRDTTAISYRLRMAA